MTEAQAREWVRARFGVSRETQLATFLDMLLAESERQNLIAASTMETAWMRHIVDSAQLLPLADEAAPGAWVDVGTGAGLPGLVAAILCDRAFVLIEPRARRAAFLQEASEALGLADRVAVLAKRVETASLSRPAAIVSARAVMALPALFKSAREISDRRTLWLLPKGRNAQSELEAARAAWQGSFHVERSITEADSMIVVAREVRPK